MPSNGYSNDQPRWYRLFLPLSAALLAHTLIIAGIIHLLPPTEPAPPEEVRFTLVKSGSNISARKSSAADSSRSSPSRPATQAERSEAFEKFTIAPLTTDSSPRTTPEEQPVKQPDPAAKQGETSQPRPQEKTTPKRRPQEPTASLSSASSPQSLSSAASVKGRQKPVTTDATTTSDTPQISDNKSKDPYVAVLWEYISKELYRHPVAGLRNLDRTRVLRMELSLLQNGAVRRVDIVKSSGNPGLDAAARRSALSASPYPQPPESAQSTGYRFQVELQFRPNRS